MSKEQSVSFRWRRLFSLVCLLGILISLFAMLMPAKADAANYKVKQWKDGDLYCYTVYTGALPKNYGPTFARTDAENYYSRDRKIRIALYTPWEDPTDAQADAFYKYLLSQTSKKAQAGWYGITYSGSYTTRYVYKIEGWNQDDPLNSLLSAGPFQNSMGYTLELVNIGHGDQVRDKWRYLRDTLQCTTAVYFGVKNPRDGATVGFRFIDENGDYIPGLYS